MERLDKIIANRGIASRREVKELLRQGRVLVDGVDGDQLTARTDGGRLVRMPGDPQIVGSFRQVRIVDSTTWSLVGQMEEAE